MYSTDPTHIPEAMKGTFTTDPRGGGQRKTSPLPFAATCENPKNGAKGKGKAK